MSCIYPHPVTVTTRIVTSLLCIPRTQMAHMLEDSTCKVEGSPPKKEVSWVLGIYIYPIFLGNKYIYIYVYMICITWHPLFLVKKFIQLKTPSSMILGKTPCYLRSSHGSPHNATPSFVSTKKNISVSEEQNGYGLELWPMWWKKQFRIVGGSVDGRNPAPIDR